MSHGEDQAKLSKNCHGAAHGPARNTEFLDELQLARNGSVRLPIRTLDPLGKNLGELTVGRNWPIRFNHIVRLNDLHRPKNLNYIFVRS
nr:hypothetical protein Ade03nite_14860 [Actinoplanes derwentensis]